MSQLVTFPTRAQNMLDLLFTTHPDSVLSCYLHPGLSDHDAVLATIQTPNRTNQQIGLQLKKNYLIYPIHTLK